MTMIKFETDSNGEGVEIIFDSNGMDEFISYLQTIRKENDHMHLIVGNELSEEKVSDNANTNVKHVKLVYLSRS
jgi:hypothetical protein